MVTDVLGRVANVSLLFRNIKSIMILIKSDANAASPIEKNISRNRASVRYIALHTV